MAYENMINNTNAEKWSLEEAHKLFDTALEMAERSDKEYDFIGEIATELKLYKEVFSYLSKKFESLEPYHKRLIGAVESNCFYNGKKGNITPSLAIMNLKSNHGWTDRVDTTTKNKEINTTQIIGMVIKDEPNENN